MRARICNLSACFVTNKAVEFIGCCRGMFGFEYAMATSDNSRRKPNFYVSALDFQARIHSEFY